MPSDASVPSNREPELFVDAWRLRCPNCGASQWERVATEPLRLVFECLSCHETGQVDLLKVEEPA